MKRITIMALAVLMALMPVMGASAETAEENAQMIYAFCGADGGAYRLLKSGEGDADFVELDAEGLPVRLQITWELDGQTVASPEELAGKSGKLKVRFDYENTCRDGDVFAPLLAVTGLLMDKEVCQNVEVTGGRALDDGSRVFVVGFALPGMQDSLGKELPSCVEVTADVTDFSMESTYTLVTDALFRSLDLSVLDPVDELTGAMGELTDAMAKLTQGADTLAGGLGALLSGMETAVDGIGALSDGLDTLAANNDTLNGGAKQILDALLASAGEQLAASGLEIPELTAENYAEVLDAACESLSEEKIQKTVTEKVEAAVREQEQAVRTAVEEAVRQEVLTQATDAAREEVKGQALAALGMKAEEYEAAEKAGAIPEDQKAKYAAAVEAQMDSEAVTQMIGAAVEQQMASEEITGMIEEKTEEQIQILIRQNLDSDEVKAQTQEALIQAKAGEARLNALKQQLDGVMEFVEGLASYTAGVAEAANGTKTLNFSAPMLKNAVNTLQDGAVTLSDGMKEFDRQGISVLAEQVNGLLGDLIRQIRKVFAVGQSGEPVKVLYKTDSIR